MPLPAIQETPAGVVLRPLSDADWLRTAVAFSDGKPVVLRETAGAVVYAGALTDAAGSVLQWLEVWVERKAASPFFQLGTAGQDAREEWKALRQCLADAGDGRMLTTGAEDAPARVFRWDAGGNLMPEGAVEGAALSWNAEEGRIFLRYAAPFDAGEYASAVSSGQLPPPGPRMGQVTMQTQRDIRHAPGFYLRCWQGVVPPLAEMLHLKLSLLLGMMQTLATALRSRRLPLLNLKTRSFGLEWAGVRSGLALWTVQPVLDQPSAATRWMEGDSDDPVFFLTEEPPPSIYRHPDVSAPRFVKGKVRLSQVKAAGSRKDQIESEGTLILTEPLPRSADTLLIQCSLSLRPIQGIITALEPSRGEVVFRTGRWHPAPEVAAALATGGQAPPPVDCECALVPRLSAPADLYSLGVIALEVLCCGSGQGLPMAVDEALRVMQRLSQEQVSVEAVPDTLAAWQRREPDANWSVVLSPRHLSAPPQDPESVSRMVPPAAWFSALSWALRLLTGAGSQAYFQEPGEGAATAPHLALEAPLRDLRALVNRTRALVTLEWKANVDLREQILAVLGGSR